ncbi:MAG: LTA synthase family protein [Eubacteriales bacterium]|nr:LTA synthase family protein [Eubacteriales bacterium]
MHNKRSTGGDGSKSIIEKLYIDIKGKLMDKQDSVNNKLSRLKFRDFLFCAIISWVLVLVVEILSRHSLIGALKFMTIDIGYFIMNFSIVFCCITLCLFFKRRYFILAMVILVWFGLGVANCIILIFRNTPLAWIDFSILRFAIDLMDSYVNLWQLILAIVGAILVVGVIVAIFKREPKKETDYFSATIWMVIAFAICCASMLFSYNIYSNAESFGNLPKAYKKYGFVYCFSCSMVNRGVDKTETYTQEGVKEIINKITEADRVSDPAKTPNIIYVQLESFFDVKHLKDVQYNQDPIPVFTSLKEKYSSGYLKIPGLGGGTANSEFEVLTGMSVSKFGACEYPYKTATLKKTAGSVCYDLKKYGYTTHAVHNHTKTFYDRHINYTNLGFDTFTSIEYMGEVERTPTNWAKDKVLIGEIFKCLDATEGKDFVFAVSVQSHGKYPKEVLDPNQPIVVTAGMETADPEYKIGFEYYINQLYEMDAAVGQLISALKSYKEPTVLVLYGDHLPAMNITEEQLINGDLYETEYVVWANYDLPVNDEYLYAYQLNSRVTELLNFKGNYINALHRYYKNDKTNPQYSDNLQTLMYDELYGKNYAYDGVSPFIKTDMTFGPDPANPIILEEDKESDLNHFQYKDREKGDRR